MKNRISEFKRVIVLPVVVVFCLISPPDVFAQHEGHNMPGVKKSKAKPKAAPKRKAKPKAKRKAAVSPQKFVKPINTPNVPVHSGHTPGMVMPSTTSAPTTTASPHRHTPGKPETGSSPTAKPQASASVTLVKEDLRGIVRAIILSRATMQNIKQNLFFAFVHNSLGVPLAAGTLYPFFGMLLSPMIAAAAMSFSSVSVIGNALRLRNLRL